MTKSDRLIILKFINLHRQILNESKALSQDWKLIIKDHPDFSIWNKLRIQVKKLDPKWLEVYLRE